MATREILPEFKGMKNVTKVTSDSGQVSYLTESISLEAEANRVGAYDYAVFENATKHVFFLFSDAGESKYYLGQKLQGKGYEFLDSVLTKMVSFFSWNPTTQKWIPCVGLSDQPSLRSQAHKLNFSR